VKHFAFEVKNEPAEDSLEAGWFVDQRINSSIYEWPTQTPRITFAPLLGRERIGVVAQVRF
jgi:hypothetical protein